MNLVKQVSSRQYWFGRHTNCKTEEMLERNSGLGPCGRVSLQRGTERGLVKPQLLETFYIQTRAADNNIGHISNTYAHIHILHSSGLSAKEMVTPPMNWVFLHQLTSRQFLIDMPTD